MCEKTDNVNCPSHYVWVRERIGVEPIKFIQLFDYNKGCALKYIVRSGAKHENGMTDKEKEIEDLCKAIKYLEFEIAMLEEQK